MFQYYPSIIIGYKIRVSTVHAPLPSILPHCRAHQTILTRSASSAPPPLLTPLLPPTNIHTHASVPIRYERMLHASADENAERAAPERTAKASASTPSASGREFTTCWGSWRRTSVVVPRAGVEEDVQDRGIRPARGPAASTPPPFAQREGKEEGKGRRCSDNDVHGAEARTHGWKHPASKHPHCTWIQLRPRIRIASSEPHVVSYEAPPCILVVVHETEQHVGPRHAPAPNPSAVRIIPPVKMSKRRKPWRAGGARILDLLQRDVLGEMDVEEAA